MVAASRAEGPPRQLQTWMNRNGNLYADRHHSLVAIAVRRLRLALYGHGSRSAEVSREHHSLDESVELPTGRIDTLAVAGDRHVWGTFDAATGRLFLSEKRRIEDQELLNFAAITTIEHRGHVIVVPAAELPEQALVAGAYRYKVARMPAK